MRHHAADVGDVIDFHPQQLELGALRRRGAERHLRESQKAGGIRGDREGLDKGRLDQVEIGLGTDAGGIGRRLRQMRGLPLRRPTR